MAKAKKSLKGLGARHGIKLRKQYTKIHLQLKEKRTCPECGSKTFGRDAVGIWSCKKCSYKVAGTAYDIKPRMSSVTAFLRTRYEVAGTA